MRVLKRLISVFRRDQRISSYVELQIFPTGNSPLRCKRKVHSLSYMMRTGFLKCIIVGVGFNANGSLIWRRPHYRPKQVVVNHTANMKGPHLPHLGRYQGLSIWSSHDEGKHSAGLWSKIRASFPG